jgi:hypothetical protein
MDKATKEKISLLVQTKIEEKLLRYKSETDYTPFFSAIFDKETIVKASLMQSLYTTFGMSIYEQIAVILAQAKGFQAHRQFQILGQIDSATERLIDKLCLSSNPNKEIELRQIKASIKPGQPLPDHESIVDVFVKKSDGTELYVDITTVKPNLKEFKSMRKKMLRWAALRYSVNQNAKLETKIGIPYNPYHPEPYERWTGNVCDPVGDMLIQNELWSAFAGANVFDELIEVFEDVGNKTQANVRAFLKKRAA